MYLDVGVYRLSLVCDLVMRLTECCSPDIALGSNFKHLKIKQLIKEGH